MNAYDTFLPSGAIIEHHRRPYHQSAKMTSPGTQIPRSVAPTYIPNFPNRRGYSSSPHTSGTPISPPKTRSASADDDSAALIEDWRAFTKKIREQAQGERAHLIADRARADEVMEEERQLWEQERNILKARIEELEMELASKGLGARSTSTSTNKSKPSTRSEFVGASGSGSSDMSPSSSIPQESGRNPDGSPFYAPRPTNPSRSFDAENQALRIDSITEPRETPIRVTSKSLRPVDFGIQSPERQAVQDTASNIIGESIDISLIQPNLDGVPIKTSAVDPIFAATVLSPQPSGSPSKRSPLVRSPNDENGPSPPGTVRRISDKKKCTIELRAAPENQRLTLHAGHTPNHSISKFDLGDLSGIATPTQSLSVNNEFVSVAVVRSEEEGDLLDHLSQNYKQDEKDHELSGPLGFSHDATSPQSEEFARELVKRLSQEALRQRMTDNLFPDINEDDLMDEEENLLASLNHATSLTQGISLSMLDVRKEVPAAESVGSRDGEESGGRSPPLDGLPRLKMKPSANFGKPFGSL